MAEVDHLRILIANERSDRLELLARVVAGLGHTVVARDTDVPTVGALTAKTRPDVAIVGLGASSEHALNLVSAIVREAFCPVIAVLPADDSLWVSEASKRGVYAYLVDDHPDELQSALDITLRRFAECQALEGAFEKRKEDAKRAQESAHAKRRQALELHDEVVQGLAVAQLALQLGRENESREAIADTLNRARSIVTRDLAELQRNGYTVPELVSEAAPAPVGD